ncbi:MAG: hypothetical protein WBD71_02955, partial [Xanthobacteraceae bacterium]
MRVAINEVTSRVTGWRRIAAPAIVICASLALGSCAGTSNEDGFSAYVADHWPQWAGGMPDDVPPRPGAPGYRQFIAHGQVDQDQAPPLAGGANSAAPVFETTAARPAKSTRAATVPPAPAALSAPAAPAPV